MHITSDKDFQELRKQFIVWRKRFPMFTHDVAQVERIIEEHIQKHSIALVKHRQTHSKSHLEEAQQEINAINQVIATVEKMELMSMLSRG
jgi:SepF-like predicted cell division protein (DUF552 family)